MKSIYIVFSATPGKMGRFIRAALHGRFNHVALAFDEDLSTMYTFARFHANMPLYGGFVQESLRRHVRRGKPSELRVCRLGIDEERYLALCELVTQMEEGGRRYLYNLYSAMFAPLHIRLLIRDSFTCAEFVGDALHIAGLDIRKGKFHSLKELERLLAPYAVYEGTCSCYDQPRDWGEDRFPEKLGRIVGTAATAHSIGRLTVRGIVGMFAAVLYHM